MSTTKDELLNCMLENSMNAIRYWLDNIKEIVRSEGRLISYEIEEDGSEGVVTKHLINTRLLEKGITNVLESESMHNMATLTFCALFKAGRYDSCDYDVTDLDNIIQYGLFGELVYA